MTAHTDLLSRDVFHKLRSAFGLNRTQVEQAINDMVDLGLAKIDWRMRLMLTPRGRRLAGEERNSRRFEYAKVEETNEPRN